MKKTIIFTILLFILAFTQTRAVAADYIVTRNDDRNNPTCVVGDCSLREAVMVSQTDGLADTIYFAGSLNGQTITLTDEIIWSGTLTITGPSASLLTIDGGAGFNRIFNMGVRRLLSRI